MQELLQSIEMLVSNLPGSAIWVSADPFGDDELLEFLDAAFKVASLRHARISSIEVGHSRHDGFVAAYWHIPISWSTSRDVIKIVFEPASAWAT
jgi:hypothetical protein